MVERRSSPRQKSFLQGRIYFNNRRTSLDCLIRDISEHGARLKFSSAVATPDVVDLHIPNRNETHRAKVQWRIGEEVGVGFILDEASPALAPNIAPADWFVRIQRLEHELALLQRRFNELQAALRQTQSAD